MDSSNGLPFVAIGNTFNPTPPVPNSGVPVTQQADSTGSTYVTTEGRKATYITTQTFTNTTASTTIFQLTGSTTKTVKVTHVFLTATSNTTSATFNNIYLSINSAAESGGATVSTPVGKFDQNDPSASATAQFYTSGANTPATLTYVSIRDLLMISSTAGTILPDRTEWTWGQRGGEKEPVLRGSSQYFTIVTTQVGIYTVEVTWTEE
jgi:hypothetical protein